MRRQNTESTLRDVGVGISVAGALHKRGSGLVLTRGAIALALLLTGVAAAVSQPIPSIWFGTWKVNVAKSTYTGAPGYKRATYTIEAADDGLKVIYESVLPRGGVQHLEWIGKLDGNDYPVQGVEEFLTYAYTPRGDRTYEISAKIDGRVAATSTVTFSSDGRTMTTTTLARGPGGQNITTTTLYEKE